MSEEQGTPVGRKSVWAVVKDNAALVTAIGALIEVLLTGAFNTCTANKDQAAQRKLEAFNAQKQRELEEAKAQNAALQTYLDQMGQMLLKQNLTLSEEDSEVRSLARARTLAVFGQLNPEGKRIALVFLHEADSIDSRNPIISLFSADLSKANLSGAYLANADLSDAIGGTDAQLEQARSLEGATMPNGQKYEDWLKSKDRESDGENSGTS